MTNTIPAVKPPEWASIRSRPKLAELIFKTWCTIATWSSLAFLAVILGTILWQAWGWFDWQFLTSFDSRSPQKAGILSGLWGTAWTMLLTFVISMPIGVGAAIYLEEYSSQGRFAQFIRVNIQNLAGVPSIVYGILGLAVFSRAFGIFERDGLIQRLTGEDYDSFKILGVVFRVPFGPCILTAALTMSLLILPVIIVATQEALRAVPSSIRHASLALGATKWQTVKHQVLPAAAPGILTGVILAMSRAIGETAPLILVGAAMYVTFAPGGIDELSDIWKNPAGLARAPFDGFTVLPIQVFNWVRQADPGFRHVAAAGIVVLLSLLLLLNGSAIMLRNHFQKRTKW